MHVPPLQSASVAQSPPLTVPLELVPELELELVLELVLELPLELPLELVVVLVLVLELELEEVWPPEPPGGVEETLPPQARIAIEEDTRKKERMEHLRGCEIPARPPSVHEPRHRGGEFVLLSTRRTLAFVHPASRSITAR